ncbi:hypothetical protein ACFXK0_12730 [Nocardia sp. NPDC059177]|uniref:hypothetical protein n=1 Tax=Nocardia sp. NPDC059177 TaxID=3346759 RepID=UPI00369160C7
MGSLWLALESCTIRAEEVSEVAVVKSGRVVAGRMHRERYAVVIRAFHGSPTAGRAITRTVWSSGHQHEADAVAGRLVDRLITDRSRAGKLGVTESGRIVFTPVDESAP